MRKVFRLGVMQLFLLLSIAVVFTSAGVPANEGPFLTGVVTNNDGYPLIGASVVLENSYVGTATRSDGSFRLHTGEGAHVIRVSHMGYESAEVEVNVVGEEHIEIALSRSAYIGEEIIVSATRAHSRVPVAFMNVDRSELESRDFGQDIPQLLSFTPSFVSSSDAGTGIGYTNFRIRGSDMNRINIMLNGVPLNDSESHGVFWVNMPDLAASLDNVQIQRGVGTSSHGAGAFGASINLQTNTLNKDPYGEVTTTAGSFNSLRNTVKVGSGMINDRFSLDARLSRISSDGYIDRASSDLKSFFISGGMHSGNSLLKVNIFSGKEVTYQAWDGVPSYMLDINRRYNGIGGYTNEFGEKVYYDNETDNYQQDHYQLFFSQELTDHLNFTTTLHYTKGYGYYEQYRENQRFSNYGLQSFELAGEAVDRSNLIRRKILDNDFYGVTYSVNYRSSKYDLTLGGAMNQYIGDHLGHIIWAEYANHVPKNYEWYFNQGKKNDFNIFSKIEYRITDNINIYGDLQYRTINYGIDGIDDDLRDISRDHDYHFFNPKAGIFYEFDSRSNAYFSWSVAHREPNRSNFKDARPGEEPRPERLDNIEAGYNLRSRNVSLNANYFLMIYNDQLVLTGEINDVGAPVMTNVPDSYRTGLELSASFRLSSQIESGINLSVSQNKIDDFTEYIDNWDYWNDPDNEPLQFANHLGTTELAFSPPVVAGGEVTYSPTDNISVNLSGKYVARQYIDNTSNIDRRLDPYFFSDLRLNYLIHRSSFGEMGLNLLVGNIFNSHYVSNAWIYRYVSQGEENYMDGYFPQAGRHFFAGLTIRF